MSRQIIVTGDSWAFASYVDAIGTSDIGFADMLAHQDYQVVNLARPGQSNKTSIESVSNFLSQHYCNDTLVFFVQSDPFRSIRPYTEFTRLVIDHSGIFNARKWVMLQDYHHLETVANQYSVPVFLIGGLSNVDQSLMTDSKWCSVLIDSWVRFLVGDRPENQSIDWSNWGIWGSDWTFDHIHINDLMNHGTISVALGSLAEQVIEELTVWDSNNLAFSADFFPDGAHPNREGHRLLFEYIMSTVLQEQ